MPVMGLIAPFSRRVHAAGTEGVDAGAKRFGRGKSPRRGVY